MMASDLSSGCTETIDILDDEKEEGEISLEDVSSSEEGGMGHLTSSYVVGRTRPCPDCKSWGECATWCNAMYHPKSQGRRDPVKGKENRHHVREMGCTMPKHTMSTLQEKNDDLVPISSDSDMEIVGLTDTSNRSKAKIKKKKRKKKDYEILTIDDLISPSSVDVSIAEVGTLKIYKEVNPVHRPSGRSKMIPRSPIRRYRSPVVARSSFRTSRSPLNYSRSPIVKRKVRSPKRSPRRHSPVRPVKKLPSKLSSPPSTWSYADRHGNVTRLLKKVKHLDSIGAHALEPSINRSKESSSLKEKLSNMFKRDGSDDHAMHFKGKSKVQISEAGNEADDEDDLALLRQKALETKQKKSSRSSDQPADVESEKKSAVNSDDQDEEALQLRMIALRSAVMKKHQNRVQRGIKTKRPTRSESPFSQSFLDDIPVPGDELLKYASPPYTPSHDSNHIEDMELDTDVEREKEKLPYSPTDKITENVPIDTTLLGIEPSDVSFINVNETIASPVFDDAQDEPVSNSNMYYDETYLPYQASQYYTYSPSQYGSEIFHPDLNDATVKDPKNFHSDNVVCDLIDGICCQEGTYSSTGVLSDTSHPFPVSKDLFASPVSPHSTFSSPHQMQQFTEQSSNDGIVFVNVDSTFRDDKSAYETPIAPGYSITDVPTTTAYATRCTESMSSNESMMTVSDLPENDADPLSSPINDRNLPAAEYIPKEAVLSQAAAEETLREPLYMQGVPDVTKDVNKIPTLINRTLVPASILKLQSNKRLQQTLPLKKRETPHPEPTFKSAEMQPVIVTAADASSSVFKPIKLRVAKKSTPMLSAPATFDDSTNETLDIPEDQRNSPRKDHETAEPEHLDGVDTSSASSKTAPERLCQTAQSKKQKCAKKNWRKSLDIARLLKNGKSSNVDVNRSANIVNGSTLDRQVATESGQSNDNADVQENSMGNGESLRLQNVTDSQEPIDSVMMEKNNHTALSTSAECPQEEHIKSHCLSTNSAPDNFDSGASDKVADTIKEVSNRRQSMDEDEDELRAILLASLKRTKLTDTNNPSVASVIPVTNSVATNIQTPAPQTLASTMTSVANATCMASNNAPSLPSRPLTLSETVKKKINNVSISVQSSNRKRSGSVDTIKSTSKKVMRKTLTSTKVVNNAKKYQNMIVQRRLNLRKLDNNVKPNENVWPNVPSAPKMSHASDTQRFVISLGSDTDSESEGERNETVPTAEKHQAFQEIPPDFEKHLNKFLREMRTEQEQSAAKSSNTPSSLSTQATKRDVPQTNSSSNMHTPLAVRHLPVSQQQEYRRLKQQILEREQLKLQRKIANNNNGNSSNKISNANVAASSPVKSLPPCEKKAHVKQDQNKLKTSERNSQPKSPTEIGRKSDDVARNTSELNVCRVSADKKLLANNSKHTNFTHLQTKDGKKAIPNDLSIRITNVTASSHTGDRTVDNSREKQSAKEKQQQQQKCVLRALSKDEINLKCMQILLKPDTIERVVTINDNSILQHDTTATVDQNENSAGHDVNMEILDELGVSNENNNNNISNFSTASTVMLPNLSVNSNESRQTHEDTMETTISLSQYEAEHQREISCDNSTSAPAENNNDSNNASRKSDATANDNGNANDVWDALKKNVKTELDSLTSLPEAEQERYLRETEHKLVARRYMVLDHLAEMSGNLRQWDMEKDVQTILAGEVKKLKEQLKIAEERLQLQRDRVSSMGPKVSTARQKINAGRCECFKLSRICSTLGNRLMGKNYKLPEAVAQLLSDKLKEVANHTRQFTKKRRHQSNDISENSYSSLSQETSELSKDTCAEENLSLQEQPENDAAVIDVAESKSDTSRLIQSNDDKGSSTISEPSLDLSQTVSCQSTPENIEEIAENAPELYNEEQITFLNQDNALSSEPKQNQSSPIEQNNKHTEESRTNESDPATSSKLESSVTDSSSQKHSEPNNKRISQQLLPSPSSTTISTTTTTTTDTTTTSTTTMTMTKTTIAPYVSILMHLKKPRNTNPHGILCPYEMMGICRDEDCQYIHQSRNQT